MPVIPGLMKVGKIFRAGGVSVNLRDLLDFKPVHGSVEIDRVESITDIENLVSPGISLGALSPEAHETLSIAMNQLAQVRLR